MKRIKYIIPLFLLVASPLVGFAQTAKSAYFLDGAFYNYQLNPAMKAERGFFSLLGGNLALGTEGNVGLSNFLFPQGDKLTTFMSGSVPQSTFLDNMPDAARLGFNLDETIMAMGFRMFGGYTTFSLSLHSDVALALPKNFFALAKKGLQQSAYDLSGINVNSTNYAAATLGYSHEIFDGFRVGVNAKYLVGLAHTNVMVDKLNIELGENRWLAQSHAQAQVGLPIEGSPVLDENGAITNVELGAYAPTATGLAFDFGVVYDMENLVPGLTLSASVVDMGKINWGHVLQLQSSDATVEFNGFEGANPNDIGGALNEEFEKLGEDANKMIEYTYEGTGEVSTKLNTTMYLGAEYEMPFYRPLSVGVMYEQRFTELEYNKYYEVRGFLNIAPLKWLEASVNYGTTTYGSSLGWMFNFHPAGIAFFVGSDFMITKVNPQFIPINELNTHFTMGFNLALGRRK